VINVTDKQLFDAAVMALANSYAPYSHFKVGAALLTIDGEIYTGCNIENISYGATVCAERVAMFKAISDGKRKFERLAIASCGINQTLEKAFPCGICRQVIEEFMPNGKIIVGNEDCIEVYTVAELLPHSFHNKF
jgi:cytidine deaminase